MKITSNIIIFLGTIFFLTITGIFLTKLPIPINFSESIKTDIWGHFGDIIGGLIGTLFSIVGIFLLIETLKGGSKAQIENRIFELLKFHRENITEITSNYDGGRYLFKKIVEEISLLYQKICDCEKTMLESEEIDENFSEEEKMNVAYLIAFFGLNINTNTKLKQKVCAFTDCDTLMEKTLTCIPEIQKEFDKNDPNHNIHIGYQFLLGHYFRHLYQTITYINNLRQLKYQEKYFYAKTLRAHLSTYEQILFFYNSISSLGEIWENSIQEKKLNKWQIFLLKIPFFKSYFLKIVDEKNYNKKLITKYNLIKNIPEGIPCIDADEVYPNVQYEGNEKSDKKSEIENFYY